MKSRKPTKSARIKRHFDYVAKQGCLVCDAHAELHHVTGYADKMGRVSRSDSRIVPLCPKHHRCGAIGGARASVEALGHRGFYDMYFIDLMAEAERLWNESEAIEQARRAA